MKKSKFNPIGFLIIGIVILVVPPAIYLGFLIPQLKDEYIVLMSSGGVVGGAGMFGTQMIPDKTRWGSIFKTASRAFSMLVVITLVQEFLKQLLGLAILLVVCYLLFLIFKELWKNARRNKDNLELAEEVARNTAEAIK